MVYAKEVMLREWDHTAALTHCMESLVSKQPRPFDLHNPIRAAELYAEREPTSIGDLRRATEEGFS